MLSAVIAAAAFAIILGVLYVINEVQALKMRPGWRRLPSVPGLPPEMEYQCWTVMPDFDAAKLSAAVVEALEALAPVLGRSVLFGALRGARLLVYELGTYPGDECTPVVLASAAGTAKSAAIERRLYGVAHALVHLVERAAGASMDITHGDWNTRGVALAVARYTQKREGR
jgi:hypothetical protein